MEFKLLLCLLILFLSEEINANNINISKNITKRAINTCSEIPYELPEVSFKSYMFSIDFTVNVQHICQDDWLKVSCESQHVPTKKQTFEFKDQKKSNSNQIQTIKLKDLTPETNYRCIVSWIGKGKVTRNYSIENNGIINTKGIPFTEFDDNGKSLKIAVNVSNQQIKKNVANVYYLDLICHKTPLSISQNCQTRICNDKRDQSRNGTFNVEIEPHTSYTIKISALSNSHNSDKIDLHERNYTTKPTVSEPVENLVVKYVNDSALTITWNAPCKVTGIIEYYQATINQSEELINITTTNTRLEYITHQEKVHSVTVRVKNIEVHELGKVKTINNCDDEKLRIQKSTKRRNDIVEIELSSKYSECFIKNYTLKYFNYYNTTDVHEQTIQPPKLVHSIKNLLPCSSYYVILYDGFKSISTIENVQTVTKEIGPPTNLRYTVGVGEITLSWKPPTINPTCVSEYEIKLYNINDATILYNETASKNHNFAKVPFDFCENYLMNISAVNTKPSAKSETKLLSKSEENLPMPINLKNVTSPVSINITWELSIMRNLCPEDKLTMICANENQTEMSFINLEEYSNELIVNNLKENTEYNCTAYFTNGIKNSPKNVVTVKTDVIGEIKINEYTASSDSFEISWEPPSGLDAGHIIGYNITMNCEKEICPGQPSCDVNLPFNTNIFSTEYSIENLSPYTNYTIKILPTTINESIHLNSTIIPFQTLPTKSGPVKYLDRDQKEINNEISVTFTWERPCPITGEIKDFTVFIRDYENLNEKGSTSNNNYKFFLKPGKLYEVTVIVNIEGIPESGVPKIETFMTDSIAPTISSEEASHFNIRKNLDEPSSTIDIKINKNLFSEDNGKIIYWKLYLSEKNETNVSEEQNVAPADWNPFSESEYEKTFRVGSVSDCTDCFKKELEGGKEYYIVIAACTSGGCTNSPIRYIKTDTRFSKVWKDYSSFIFGFLLLLENSVLVSYLIYRYRQCITNKWNTWFKKENNIENVPPEYDEVNMRPEDNAENIPPVYDEVNIRPEDNAQRPISEHMYDYIELPASRVQSNRPKENAEYVEIL